MAVTDPGPFGQLLVQEGFAEPQTVTGIVTTMGLNNYQKVSQLLQIVDARIKTSQNATEMFQKFVQMFQDPLGLNRKDLAQRLIQSYSMCQLEFTLLLCTSV